MSDYSPTWRQVFDMICNKQIGRGMTRTVWTTDILPNSVVKVEDGAGQFQNIIEWETWNRVKDTPYSRWFARCEWVSNNGSVLIMERTRPPAPKEFPAQMPTFLCDFKRTNYGMAKNKDGRREWFVCHDYGTHLMFENGMTKKMKKAEWWDE